MSLASGADLKLGAYELVLAKDVQGHYAHRYETQFANRLDISGSPGKQGLRPEIMLFGYDDWSGGEGNEFYDPNRPNVYYQGQANGRNVGKLVQPPLRTGATMTTNATPNKLMLVAASGKLYLGAGCDATAGGANQVFETTDLSTFTSKNVGFVADEVLTAMASDGHYLYVSSYKTSSTTRKIRRYNPDAGSNAQFAADATSTVKDLGLAFLPIAVGGRLYTWNGKRLLEYDTLAALPLANPTPVYKAAVDDPPAAATGDIIACDNSVVFFYSAEGKSFLMEYGLASQGGARPLWNPPPGFVIKQIAYQLGVVFVGGDYQGTVALFAVSLVSRQPLFIGYIRQASSLTHGDMSASFGSDVLIQTSNGHLFNYNASLDAVSEIDDATATSGTFAATGTYKGKRLSAKYSTTTTTVYNFGFDHGTLSAAQSSMPESPAWDFGLPHAKKVLYGFHVVSNTLDAGGNNIVVAYDLDETGSYTSLTSLTSGTNNFAAMVTPTDFRMMRFKVTLNGTAKCYSIYAEVGCLDHSEIWELAIDLRPQSYVNTKISADDPDVIRADILKMCELRSTVAFRDGVPFSAELDVAWDGTTLANVATSGYRAYTVAIENPEDITNAGTAEGVLRLRLRKVRTS